MSYNTDGNLAALAAYEREQDALAAADEALEQAQAGLSDGLFEAYFNGKENAVLEVNDQLTEEQYPDRLIELNREYFNRPIEYHDQYREMIIEICDQIANGYDDIEEVERAGLDLL